MISEYSPEDRRSLMDVRSCWRDANDSTPPTDMIRNEEGFFVLKPGGLY
jgi:hypothetical protein